MRTLAFVLTLVGGVATHVHAADYQKLTFISDTLGVNSGRVCVGAPIGDKLSDIGCPTDAPLLIGDGISVAGIVTASFFEGDGSRLTGISSGSGQGDRISTTDMVSGAGLGMVVASYGTVSFTTGGVEGTSYLDTSGRWIGPGISITTAHGISSTNGYFTGLLGVGTASPNATLEVAGTISATDIVVTGVISASSHVVVGTSSATCEGATKGALRYSTVSGTVEYCNSTAWNSLGISASEAVPAFTVTKDSTQALAASDVVTWETAITNNQNGFDLSTERFTAPVSGYYYLHFSGLTDNDQLAGNCNIHKNGVSSGLRGYVKAVPSTNLYRPFVAQGVLYLAAGDYVDVRANSALSTSLFGGSGSSVTTFSGFLLGGGGGGGGASVAGADTQVQFNDGGSALGGDSGLTFDKTTDVLTVGGLTTSGIITATTRVATAEVCDETGANCVAVGDIGTGSGSADRISSSGDEAMVLAMPGGTVSFTTGGVEGTSYLDTSGRWIGPGISLTTAHGISSTNGYFNGWVGIGTNAPSTTLTVSGTTYTRDLNLELWAGAAVPVSISVASGSESDPEVGTLTSGKWCTTDGSAVNCTSDAPSAVAGTDTQVQFNDGGSALGGDSGLTFDKTTDVLTVANAVETTSLTATGYVSSTQLRVASGNPDTCSDGAPVGTMRVNPANGRVEMCRP